MSQERDPFVKVQARADFDKAKSKAFFNDLFSRIFKKNNTLFQFEEVKHLLSPHGMVYRGIRSIPLNKIIGSEGRYHEFDINFMPKAMHNRSRWENVDVLRLKQVELPPIDVYKLGDHYFVKDGNHRVSVARELGQEFIDAVVIELFSKVQMDEENLSEKGLLIAHSKGYFLESTKLDEIVPESDIELTTPWGYYRLLEHINNYKYIVSERAGREYDWFEAVKSWYYDLYTPVTFTINFYHVLKSFPGRTEGDLYIWVMDHWHFLKEKYGEVQIEDAVKDFRKKFGKSGLGKILRKISEWIKNLIFGKKNEKN